MTEYTIVPTVIAATRPKGKCGLSRGKHPFGKVGSFADARGDDCRVACARTSQVDGRADPISAVEGTPGSPLEQLLQVFGDAAGP